MPSIKFTQPALKDVGTLPSAHQCPEDKKLHPDKWPETWTLAEIDKLITAFIKRTYLRKRWMEPIFVGYGTSEVLVLRVMFHDYPREVIEDKLRAYCRDNWVLAYGIIHEAWMSRNRGYASPSLDPERVEILSTTIVAPDGIAIKHDEIIRDKKERVKRLTPSTKFAELASKLASTDSADIVSWELRLLESAPTAEEVKAEDALIAKLGSPSEGEA